MRAHVAMIHMCFTLFSERPYLTLVFVITVGYLLLLLLLLLFCGKSIVFVAHDELLQRPVTSDLHSENYIRVMMNRPKILCDQTSFRQDRARDIRIQACELGPLWQKYLIQERRLLFLITLQPGAQQGRGKNNFMSDRIKWFQKKKEHFGRVCPFLWSRITTETEVHSAL